MMFRISNVGPLREAEVDLSKRLIVLTGPNNTGKTYLAWSVYGLHKFDFKDLSGLFHRYAESLLTSPHYEIKLTSSDYEELTAEISTKFARHIHHCFASERTQFEGAKINIVESEVDEVATYMYGLGRILSTKAAALETVLLCKPLGTDRLMWRLLSEETFKAIYGLGRPEAINAIVSGEIVEGTSIRLRELNDDKRVLLRERLVALVRGLFVLDFPLWFIPNCIIFPAERIAVNIFAKELALKRTELVDELVDAEIDGQRQVPMDLVRRSAGRYPWPIRDSLSVANDLAQLRKAESPFADLAAELESAVLGGKLTVSDEGEMSFSPGSAPDKRLEMHLTASVVKSLSSLVFYFRHLARKGDFLIIDEPELNLHPDNQRKLARILAKAIKRGFKIMMSTHSDYIVRELNHMIMLSKLAADDARSLGYDPECALAPESVGVYLFDEHTARSLPVSETGFSVPTIDEQINALNADAQRLYARVLGEEST